MLGFARINLSCMPLHLRDILASKDENGVMKCMGQFSCPVSQEVFKLLLLLPLYTLF